MHARPRLTPAAQQQKDIARQTLEPLHYITASSRRHASVFAAPAAPLKFIQQSRSRPHSPKQPLWFVLRFCVFWDHSLFLFLEVRVSFDAQPFQSFLKLFNLLRRVQARFFSVLDPEDDVA